MGRLWAANEGHTVRENISLKCRSLGASFSKNRISLTVGNPLSVCTSEVDLPFEFVDKSLKRDYLTA